MRFLCLPLLWSAALLEFGSCSDLYKAEVYVVASNPQEYGVSVVTTTYPATVINTNQDADDSKQQTASISSPSSSSSQDKTSPPFPNLPDSSSGVHQDPTSISTSETPLSACTCQQKELISPSTPDASFSKAEVSPPSRSTPADVPVTLESRSSAAQEIPGDTFCRTREINNNQCRRNAQPSAGETTDANSDTLRNFNCKTACCSTPPKHIPQSQTQTRTQSDQSTTLDNTKTNQVKTSGIPPDETPATAQTTANRVTAEDITPKQTSERLGATNQHLINKTEPYQQPQSNLAVNLQPTPTDQKRSGVQQITSNRGRTSERPPITQSATIQQAKGPTQAAIQQLVVLPTNPADETGSTHEAPINQTGVAQPVLTTPPIIPEIKQAPSNQTIFNQTETPTTTGTAHEIPNNRTGFNQTEIPTKTGTIHEIPNNRTGFNQTQTLTMKETTQEIPTNQTGFNQTEPLTKIGGIQEIPTNQTGVNRTETLTKTGATQEIPTIQTGLNQTEPLSKTETTQEISTNEKRFNQTLTKTEANQGSSTNQTRLNQTEPLSKKEVNQEIPTNQTTFNQTTPSLPSGFNQTEHMNNKTYQPRSLNQTQNERAMKRKLNRRRKIARDRAESRANQTEFNQTDIPNERPGGTPLPRALGPTPSEGQLERLLKRKRIPPNDPRSRIPACTCLEEVIAKTVKCKQPCARTAELTTMLFTHCIIILIVYVVLLAFLYYRFSRRRKEEEEWCREALRWKCRERKMQWMTKMFS